MHSHNASQTLWPLYSLILLKITENLKEFCLCGLYLFTTLEVKGEKFLKHRRTQAPVPSALRAVTLSYILSPPENSTAHM